MTAPLCRCNLCRVLVRDLVRRALLRMCREDRFSPELSEAIRIHFTDPLDLKKELNLMETEAIHHPQLREAVTFVDADGHYHNALVQYLWPPAHALSTHVINLVYLDEAANAVQYRSSVGPFVEGVTPETGIQYWKPGTVTIVPPAEEEAEGAAPTSEDEAAVGEEEVETEAATGGEAEAEPEAEPSGA